MMVVGDVVDVHVHWHHPLDGEQCSLGRGPITLLLKGFAGTPEGRIKVEREGRMPVEIGACFANGAWHSGHRWSCPDGAHPGVSA